MFGIYPPVCYFAGRRAARTRYSLELGGIIVTALVMADLVGPDGLIVLAVLLIVLLFGGAKLPKLARGLGSASHEFKKGLEQGGQSSEAGE
jgi:sec-independent protein translocase protein TatA